MNEEKFKDIGKCTLKAKASVIDCNILGVEIGTTGYCGEDSGHGGRTYFKLKDIADTDIDCRITKDENGHKCIEIVLGGDSELDTLINALQWSADSFKKLVKGKLESDFFKLKPINNRPRGVIGDMSAEEFNDGLFEENHNPDCIGLPIYMGTIKEDENNNGLNIYIIEAIVKNVICFDSFSPNEFDVEGKTFWTPGGMGEFWKIINDKDEDLGMFILNLSLESLIEDLIERINAIEIAKDSIEWFQLGLHCNNDGYPSVFKYENGEFVNTDIEAERFYENENWDGSNINVE